MLYLHGRNPLVPDGSNYIITGDSGQVRQAGIDGTAYYDSICLVTEGAGRWACGFQAFDCAYT